MRLGAARAGGSPASASQAAAIEEDEEDEEEEEGSARGGSHVLQLVNKATSRREVAVCSKGRVAHVSLPAASITTARWD